jgi:putative DNA-invertase from lambdoid prophage Rac
LRLDRWGRSLVDLVNTLQELTALDVGFVSLSEALDLTTPSGRALAGMLAVFAEFERDILRDWVKAGIDQARKDGKPHGRPMTAGKLVPEMNQLRKDGISKRAIARQLGVSRTSVIRLLRSRKRYWRGPFSSPGTGFFSTVRLCGKIIDWTACTLAGHNVQQL